uniref:Ras GTPase-activating protein-binding protein 2 n=1 Tax=Loa loa TaxID=7209 RepID=A0A1I7W172_LOALO
MKMEGVGDVMNGRTNEVAKTPQPSPKEIGREFVRQYYTMLSERPQDVFRFYSHESYFAHDTDQPVQGQQKIQKAIERLAFVDCKARIYTVSGTATMNNGLVIQVCGELSIGDNPGRRFLQTFILCPQTPKKYYVHNDVFQWLDRAFGDTVIQPQKNDIQTQIATEENVAPNGEAGGINGHTQAVSASHNQIETIVQSPDSLKKEQHLEPIQAVNASAIVQDAKHQMNDIASSKSDDSSAEEAQTEDSNSVTVDSAPKTWAKLVGGNQTAAVTIAAQLQNMTLTTAQPPVRLPIIQNSASISPSNNANLLSNFEDNCRLYVGGITRNIVPESAAAIERDIRFEFEKFGHVAAVNVPRRVLDSADPQRTVFAFVVMRTPEGARNAFNAARKERSLSLLHLKIDSLGFDGEATLSEQKGGQMNPRTPFIHRGPTLQGLSRGGFNVRNGSGGGRGGGGGSRGLRHYSGASEYRQSNEHGRH